MDSKSSPTEGFESVASAYRSVSNDGGHQPHSSMADRDNMLPRHISPGVRSALEGVRFIAQHIKDADKDNEVVEDWKYISMVLDRLFLWVFFLACLGGTFGIILQAPSLYDQRIPIDQQLSEIPLRRNNFQLPEEHVQRHEL